MLCRYMCKGHDRAIARVAAEGSEEQVVDEPKDYQDGRYLGTCEAVWRYLLPWLGSWPTTCRLYCIWCVLQQGSGG